MIDALVAGQCVLFAGAGLSVQAGLPSWNALVDELAGELNLPRRDDDHLQVAQSYRDRPGGSERLARLIERRFAGNRLSTLSHYLLLLLPIRAIFTTNYDPLLEGMRSRDSWDEGGTGRSGPLGADALGQEL